MLSSVYDALWLISIATATDMRHWEYKISHIDADYILGEFMLRSKENNSANIFPLQYSPRVASNQI